MGMFRAIAEGFKDRHDDKVKEAQAAQVKQLQQQLGLSSDIKDKSDIITTWETDYDGSDMHVTTGPFSHEDDDGEIIITALRLNSALEALFRGFVDLIRFYGDTKELEWYKGYRKEYISNICGVNYERVINMNKELMTRCPNLFVQAEEIYSSSTIEGKLFRIMLDDAICIDVLKGKFKDTANLAVLTTEEARNTLNKYPINSNNKSSTDRVSSLIVATWIYCLCYDTENKGENARNKYRELLNTISKLLAYKSMPDISIEEAFAKTGINPQIVSIDNKSFIKMCKTNKDIAEFNNLVNRINMRVHNGLDKQLNISIHIEHVSKSKLENGHTLSVHEGSQTFKLEETENGYKIALIENKNGNNKIEHMTGG